MVVCFLGKTGEEERVVGFDHSFDPGIIKRFYYKTYNQFWAWGVTGPRGVWFGLG